MDNMITLYNSSNINTNPCPNCILCGARGELLYQYLNDRLYGVSGQWNLKKCPNTKCALIWLDPMPSEEDIIKVYVNYFTHQDKNQDTYPLISDLYNIIKEGYLASKYGYSIDSLPTWKKFLGNLILLNPLKYGRTDLKVRYLPAQTGGRLLDVGCGSGEWLKFMHNLGWDVEGIDIDPISIENARDKGLKVKLGTLEAQEYPDNHFDAMAMSHVIEHIHSPLQTMKECYRILKAGANLVVITPNSHSLGHRIFKQNWRGLEPPRHLLLFNVRALKKAIIDAGFNIVSVSTTLRGSYTLHQSYALSKNATSCNGKLHLGPLESLTVIVLTIIELLFLWVNRYVGEDIVVLAKKANMTGNEK